MLPTSLQDSPSYFNCVVYLTRLIPDKISTGLNGLKNDLTPMSRTLSCLKYG